MTSGVEAALRRHRVVTILALAVLIVLAWLWTLGGAGTAMTPAVSLAPVQGEPQSMPGMDMGGAMAVAPYWSLGNLGLTFSMWWVMMVAMMLPSAAPTILLYARAAAGHQNGVRPHTEYFLLGYLLIWGIFSLVATGLQIGLGQISLFDPMYMSSNSHALSGVVLISAGIYQLTPLKETCLRQCRNPAQFLSRHYRQGALGALRMGMLHGSFCVGCCWMLMALLFVGGVMNLVWIALLTLLVAGEKLLPFGRQFGIAAGLGCLVWGVIIMAS